MHPRCPLLLAPPQRLAIDGDTLGGGLGGGRCRQQPFGPRAQLGFSRLTIAPLQDRVEGRGARRLAGKPQGVRQACAIVAPPGGHGRITPVPAHQGATHEGEDGDQRVTLSLRATEIRHLGQDLDERARLCYPGRSSFDQSVLARVRTVRGLPHVGQNALLLLCRPLSTSLLKTE
jgi:hypothetical protein